MNRLQKYVPLALHLHPHSCFVRLRSREDEALKSQNKHDLISTWLRRCLKEWEIDIDDLPDEFSKTVKGRQEINTFKQTKIYLKPLFKMLKTRSLEGDILERLGEIIKWCRRREYTKAADEYLLLSIGKAAWPMGVTMVGIHERSAREKIFSQDVAHILNDETQRKFIQSVKRLMTYSQNKYPPAASPRPSSPPASTSTPRATFER
ncbi:hypothetical protein GUITHDRAFT_75725 [Guillardia theta CCMP2712]|uniref:Pre-mRNA-splicing factor 18 n=1 Tax=Guillardia theta (strain CCMP2712) TaxID=905079 RepID=L1IVI2_GUITC|nr:hypothetical protein GUITHDRAFT_75725 [Guillardia theta CCMP2712]EKX40253.1 hypothetical protein GUITHDRAFT_75725 [Guillardia theta CCMP2712]|eukprot:XP_005827233.1 hypothetical protein GUITHDRAFT_75725 [Guillardia theta CCMP2712]